MNERIKELMNQTGVPVSMPFDKWCEKFAELVRADEREKVAQWMIGRSFTTGHGDSIEDLLKEIEWQAAEREREACAEICDWISEHYETRTDLNQTQKQVGQLAAEVCGVRIRERERNE